MSTISATVVSRRVQAVFYAVTILAAVAAAAAVVVFVVVIWAMSLLLLCRGFCLRQIQLLLDVTSALIVHLPFQINESHLGILLQASMCQLAVSLRNRVERLPHDLRSSVAD